MCFFVGGDGTAKAVPLSILTSPLFSQSASNLTTQHILSEGGSPDSPLWRQADKQEHLRQQLSSLSSQHSLWSQQQPQPQQQQQQQEAKPPPPGQLRPPEEKSKSSSRALASPERGKEAIAYSSSSSSSSRLPSAKPQGAAGRDGEQQEPGTLEEFLHQSSMPHNKKACTFQAQMQLPDGGMEKLTSFVRSTGRVRGLSLSQNNISDAQVKVSRRYIIRKRCHSITLAFAHSAAGQ